MIRARTQIEHAAAWATSFKLDDAPEDVIKLSTLQVANILAAILAGSRSAAGRKIWQACKSTFRSGPCFAIPHGDLITLMDALYLHAAYANALELDDFHYRGHLGPASVVVPLALADAYGIDGPNFLRAQIVANEVAGRLGWAVTAELRHGHQRSYLLRFAAAAAAGVLVGLDQAGMTAALSIAMTQPEQALHPGMFSPDTKVLSAGSSVVEGVRAAFLAAEGITAAGDILENAGGFYRQFTMQRTVANPFVQFGEAWCTHALSFKRYSACAYASGAVDAAREITGGEGLDVSLIERVEVASSLPALIMEKLADPHIEGLYTPVNVQFSILRSTAAALALGDLRGFHFEREAFEDMLGPIKALANRGRLVHDWKFTIHQLQGLDAGLRDGGSRDSADMFQFYRTSRAFRSMFGSARAIGPRDVAKILLLPGNYRNYFLGRWKRSLASRLLPNRKNDRDGGPMGDLRLLSFRMGARVVVTLKDGRKLEAENVIPTGMAGDPDRLGVVREKFLAEGERVLGHVQCEKLWSLIMELPKTSSASVSRMATRLFEGSVR